MATTPSVLLLDDGELEDVRGLLDELGAEVLHLRSAAIPDALSPPSDLFVTTPRRARIADQWPLPSGPHGKPIKVAVVTEDSNALRAGLRNSGFDLLVRRPVHPYALRMVLAKALFLGKERRNAERLPIGCEVSYRTGLRHRTALLAELSMRGCRLISSHALGVGTGVTLQIPEELSGGLPFPLRAQVVRCTGRGSGGRYGEHLIGLSFRNLGFETSQRLEAVLRQLAAGPVVLSTEQAVELGAETIEDSRRRAARGAPPPSRPSSAAAGGEANPSRGDAPLAGGPAKAERRKTPRAAFNQRVVFLGDQANRVVLGRDLSVGGMRIDPHPDLQPGDRMRVAIYGAPREEPFVVVARVLRNEGIRGVAVEFDELPSTVAAQLEAVVARLPSVESLQDGELDNVGTVVSEILEAETE